MNNKGFLKIVEATIALVIIIGVLFFTYSGRIQSSEPDLSERARSILGELSKNPALRNEILGENSGAPVDDFILNKIPENYLEYELRICEIKSACGRTTLSSGEVFAGERLFSSSISVAEFEPKKVRLFIWRKGT